MVTTESVVVQCVVMSVARPVTGRGMFCCSCFSGSPTSLLRKSAGHKEIQHWRICLEGTKGDFHRFSVSRKNWAKNTSSKLTRMHSLQFYEGVGGAVDLFIAPLVTCFLLQRMVQYPWLGSRYEYWTGKDNEDSFGRFSPLRVNI